LEKYEINRRAMKQTAVEFLVEEISFLKDMNFDFGDGLPKDIIDKAKEMEKEQIINTWDNGYDKGTRDRIEKISNPVGNAEQYYNETYKSE
jgi:hypothetical protein